MESNGIYKLFSKAEKIMALNSPAMQFAMYAALICICFFGSKIIISTTETELTTGNLTQTVGGTPITNTFSTRDKAGTYQATSYGKSFCIKA